MLSLFLTGATCSGLYFLILAFAQWGFVDSSTCSLSSPSIHWLSHKCSLKTGLSLMGRFNKVIFDHMLSLVTGSREMLGLYTVYVISFIIGEVISFYSSEFSSSFKIDIRDSFGRV